MKNKDKNNMKKVENDLKIKDTKKSKIFCALATPRAATGFQKSNSQSRSWYKGFGLKMSKEHTALAVGGGSWI